MRGGSNRVMPAITLSPNPFRGGSTTTKSGRSLPSSLLRYWYTVARTAFTFGGELYSRSAWEVGDDSTAITLLNSRCRTEENRPTPAYRSSAIAPERPAVTIVVSSSVRYRLI